jgi:hypothetical protein
MHFAVVVDADLAPAEGSGVVPVAGNGRKHESVLQQFFSLFSIALRPLSQL